MKKLAEDLCLLSKSVASGALNLFGHQWSIAPSSQPPLLKTLQKNALAAKPLSACRNRKNCLWKYFFYSYVDPIHSWHLTRQLNKEDLDLCTWAFSCFLCPGFHGRSLFGPSLLQVFGSTCFWVAWAWCSLFLIPCLPFCSVKRNNQPD